VRREYTLPELAATVGMTERNIRAYRSRGLIPPPRLRGRVGYYGFDHIAKLRLVQALTGRGLSLAVVGQLLDRGLAQHELARLIRQELPGGPPVLVSEAVVEEVGSSDPELLRTLVEHGVARRTERGVEADPALMSLANQLVSDGVPMLDVARLCLAGAEAASAVQERVGGTLPAAPRPSASDDPAASRAAGPGGGAEAREESARDDGGVDGTNGIQVDARPDAATTAVALELTTTAFRLALESWLSRPER
jgi:DNA-binding transcriptional MerR regulator